MLKEKGIYGQFLAGEWSLSQSDELLESRNPTDGSLRGWVPEATPQEVSRAAQVADEAFWHWRLTPTDLRMKFGLALARLLDEEHDSLVQTICEEVGKTRFDAILDVREAIGVVQVVAPMAVNMTGKAYTNILPGMTMECRAEPRGVAAIITPFNFPIAIPVAHIVAALITGNTVVWKPAPEAPECSQKLASLIIKALQETEKKTGSSLPRGVFQMILGDSKAGDCLIRQDAVQTISFTGSKAVGDKVDSIASGLGKRVLKELGGINLHYWDETADPENAARQVLYAKTITNGQRCTSLQELLIDQTIYEQVKERLIAGLERVVMGDPLSWEVWEADNDPNRFGLGPLVSQKQKERAERIMSQSLNEGARLVDRGSVPANLQNGYFFPLTIVEKVSDANILAREEIFAPVLVLRPVSGITEALDIINRRRIGIVACIHTTDLNRAEFFLQNVLRTRVDVNRHGTGALWGTKFGGDRGSGSGNPALDSEMVYGYVLWKTIYRAYTTPKD
ncbi:MAG: aldehyde dehydrogenase family protein [Armatimonadetes bacterium]|nr:aldehyde dehydrogenase family protein [Armatimonadota bacterium]MDW8121952.1 aldehyde dehydrogenase family protein [Armatimonadota bacterium]